MGEFDNREREEVFSKKVRAGKRTYFFDVKATRSNDYYVTITESKKRLEDGVFIKHKIFLYKEDFEKFAEGLMGTIDYIKANQDVVEKRYEFSEAPEVANTTATTDDDFSFEIWAKQSKLITKQSESLPKTGFLVYWTGRRYTPPVLLPYLR